jgi:phosphatidylglycerol---prolipoprotein diacylglyceryl transferase
VSKNAGGIQSASDTPETGIAVFPYLEIHPLPIGPVSIQPFGTLVVIGILAGYQVLERRLTRQGLEKDVGPGFRFWMVMAGFAGAVLAKVFYNPDFFEIILAGPSRWADLYGGIASFGGIIAGAAGGIVYLRRNKVSWADMVRYLDGVAYAFPAALFFGRIGCYIAHDHPGLRTDSWLAVRYPGGPRYDLGLLEALFLIPLTALIWWLGRKPRPAGFLSGVFFTLYGLFRLLIDQLHEAPPRYWGFTVDQIFSVLALAAGAGFFYLAARARARNAA